MLRGEDVRKTLERISNERGTVPLATLAKEAVFRQFSRSKTVISRYCNEGDHLELASIMEAHGAVVFQISVLRSDYAEVFAKIPEGTETSSMDLEIQKKLDISTGKGVV
jgi:hypothetical protein